ncbi:hypothetical protein [Holdemanella porci]|uniref:hypothetical protein n=1 Tax=Holdemanella porci TaxID=2652276 RepID=UPI00388DDE86
MNKRYEYGGLIYCEDDLSEEIDNYGGSLYDLFYNLESDGRAGYAEVYYKKESSELYESYEDLIETEFSELEVDENE